mmetsp:Transcript_9323/g.20649  ORF Transcript_9323/g.20649 Transcript_9323/m.20649 type:complete len:269 (+) Transcript_9323:327-1133(+)
MPTCLGRPKGLLRPIPRQLRGIVRHSRLEAAGVALREGVVGILGLVVVPRVTILYCKLTTPTAALSIVLLVAVVGFVLQRLLLLPFQLDLFLLLPGLPTWIVGLPRALRSAKRWQIRVNHGIPFLVVSHGGHLVGRGTQIRAGSEDVCLCEPRGFHAGRVHLLHHAALNQGAGDAAHHAARDHTDGPVHQQAHTESRQSARSNTPFACRPLQHLVRGQAISQAYEVGDCHGDQKPQTVSKVAHQQPMREQAAINPTNHAKRAGHHPGS